MFRRLIFCFFCVTLLGASQAFSQGDAVAVPIQANGVNAGVNSGMSMQLVVSILRVAEPSFSQSLGGLIAAYNQGICTIEPIALATGPGFLVRMGGILVSILESDL